MWFPSRKHGEARDGQRWAFMFRWSTGRTRSFANAYPHRLLMTEEEKVQVQGRKVSAAALAHKRANPPEATRPLSKRVRVA